MVNFGNIVDIGHVVFGEAGTFIDKDTLTETSISIVKLKPEEFANFGVNDFVVPTLTVNIRSSEISDVVEGDQVKIGATTYFIVGAPQLDTQQLMWTVRLAE